MRKPKVLFIGPLPPPYSGPEISANLFVNSRVKDEFELVVLNTNFRKSNSDKGKLGFSLVKAFFILNTKLIKQLITNRPDIIYYYVTATMLGWIGKDIWVILISKLFRKKVVIHMRAGHFRSNYDNANFIFKTFIKFALNRTSYNLAQSESLARQYDGLVRDRKKIGYIYNMIDLQSINESLDYDPNIILYLGHLSHAKGYCDVLEIIPEIANLFPEVKFCFAGTFIHQERNVLRNSIDGTLIHPKNSNDLYKKLIKDKLEHNYQYLGMISGAEKDYWISRCNFMILPSYSEGFSMAVLEGLAHAKPIITTPVGALKDIITHGENGFLQNPGDKNSLRDNIIELLSDKRLRDSFALNNQKKRLDFSIQKIEMEYINLFKSLL